MDEIRIENLEIYAGHGVFEEENRNGQAFLVNVTLYTDTRAAGQKDDLTLSTHYGEVSHLIHRCLREKNFKLIEAAAEYVAEQILLQFPLVRKLALELRKPSAPIGLPFESVSVKIQRGWKKAYLGIGSNMGDKEKYMNEAVGKIKAHPMVRNVQISELLVTKPYGGVEQDDFVNGAVGLETLLSPTELLHFLQRTELEAGRERKIHWGPRTLDLDILLYEDVISQTEELMIPHPDMHNREFVLKPLAQLCPYEMHPLLHKSVSQMLEEINNGVSVK